MKKDLTELVFILDMSGSMSNLTDDTIGGFNSVLREHAARDGEVLVTTYLFNNESKMLHDRVPIREVRAMTSKDYVASGCTALLDAMGEAIEHIAGIHHYARQEDIPEHTIFIITTDGMENASHHFSSETIKKMVSCQQEQSCWEFIFLAANIDAVETAEQYGIDAPLAVDYLADSAGTETAYASVSSAIKSIRIGKNVRADKTWREKADEDYQKRGK